MNEYIMGYNLFDEVPYNVCFQVIIFILRIEVDKTEIKLCFFPRCKISTEYFYYKNNI